MKLFISRIKSVFHSIKNSHHEIVYKIDGKIFKIKCKECKSIFYENFPNIESKEYFEKFTEPEIDENSKAD